MDSRANRITRDELLTPPEFKGLESREHQAARVGGARIELVRVGDETRLGTCYQQVPMRVMPPFVLDNESASLLYLINLTAGLMDGDGHLVQIKARAGTRAVVSGQSASRVHPALSSFATQQFEVEVEDDACLIVLPGPTIPFQGCRYYQRGRATLAPTARMIWGDVWLPGRYNRGELSERFRFERIIQDFEVRRAGSLIFRDRFRWDGPWSPAVSDWYFGGELATASLFIAGPAPEFLTDAPPTPGRSIFRLESGDTCVRWCGHPMNITAEIARMAFLIAGVWGGGSDAAPWLLDSGNLAPNHWFSSLD